MVFCTFEPFATVTSVYYNILSLHLVLKPKLKNYLSFVLNMNSAVFDDCRFARAEKYPSLCMSGRVISLHLKIKKAILAPPSRKERNYG